MVEDNTSGTITIKKDQLWKYSTFVLAALVIVIAIVAFTGDDNPGSVTGNVVQNPTPQPGQIQKVEVEIEDNDPVLGDKDAPVTIVEFSDFQCPFCERAYSGAVAELKNSDYFKKGEVNFIYKHFPLNSIHPQAQKAAEASECARRQGNENFWKYHDALFENQQSLGVESLKQYASQVGLNTQQFNKCLDGGEATAEVNKETTQATNAGGRGTPYFVVVNNKDKTTAPVSGAVPWSNLEAAIKSVM